MGSGRKISIGESNQQGLQAKFVREAVAVRTIVSGCDGERFCGANRDRAIESRYKMYAYTYLGTFVL